MKHECNKNRSNNSANVRFGVISYDGIVTPSVVTGIQELLKSVGFPVTCETWRFLAKHAHASVPDSQCGRFNVTAKSARRELEENWVEYYATVRDHRNFDPNSWRLEAPDYSGGGNLSSDCASVVAMIGQHDFCRPDN